MKLEKYSFGIGDRFSQQGEAQLKALMKAKEMGIEIVPVWNKSNREHQIIRSSPADTRKEADQAVSALGWTDPFYVDADHINLVTVNPFMEHSDFFTLDVADYIGSEAEAKEMENFLTRASAYTGEVKIPGIGDPFLISPDTLREIAGKFLGAVAKAAQIYKHIESKKGAGNFIAEVSMDEVESAQTPEELFFILLMISHYGIPAQTIAPKFTGRFNKGVDYVGDVDQFRREFEQDLLVIDFAVKTFELPDNLKLSIHSGSDKFTIYPVMAKHTRGLVHLKTAGTSYLEALRAIAGIDPQLFRKILVFSFARYDEDKATYHVSADPSQALRSEDLTDDALATVLDNFHNRQMLHVTFGSVLTTLQDDGSYLFKDRFFAALRSDKEAYYDVLEIHFDKHLIPFK